MKLGENTTFSYRFPYRFWNNCFGRVHQNYNFQWYSQGKKNSSRFLSYQSKEKNGENNERTRDVTASAILNTDSVIYV